MTPLIEECKRLYVLRLLHRCFLHDVMVQLWYRQVFDELVRAKEWEGRDLVARPYQFNSSVLFRDRCLRRSHSELLSCRGDPLASKKLLLSCSRISKTSLIISVITAGGNLNRILCPTECSRPSPSVPRLYLWLVDAAGIAEDIMLTIDCKSRSCWMWCRSQPLRASCNCSCSDLVKARDMSPVNRWRLCSIFYRRP
jgi:hypothetical protein